MKKIIFALCLFSFCAYGDEDNYGRVLHCTGEGLQEYHISSIDIFEHDTMFTARIQKHPTSETVFTAVTEEYKDTYYFSSKEVGSFIVKKGWSAKWIFLPASAEQFDASEIDCN